jgi:hypothetical protein
MYISGKEIALACMAVLLAAGTAWAGAGDRRVRPSIRPGDRVYVPPPQALPPRQVPSPLNSQNDNRPRLQPNVRGESLDGTRIPQTDPPQ